MFVEPKLPYRNPLLPIEQRIADLLGRMTLEEKIAQMSVLDWIEEGITGYDDLDRLRETFKHGLGIPAFAIDEVLHGLVAQGSTTFPQDRYRPCT